MNVVPRVYNFKFSSDCEMFWDEDSESGIRTYQLVITFESNLGDLPALEVDVSGLTDTTSDDPIISNVRGYHETVGPILIGGKTVVVYGNESEGWGV